jgi:glycosyltransferase involved in cell wall biosynthesis
VICVSRAEADLLERHFPNVKDRVRVVPNGVDRGELDAADPMPWPGVLVVSAGRLETYKHVDKTVAAMRELPEDFTLIVTGDGPERARLEALVADFGLSGRVKLLGRVDVAELYRWYKRADVYVSMSTNEAMPVTIVETLAAGARVVASDIPAHRDIRARTRGAITITPVEVTAADLAFAIRAAAESAPSPDQDVPTWRDVADQTLQVYREAMSRV